MAESQEPRNYSSYQQKVIQRYYNEQPTLMLTRLSNIVGDMYLASEKKKPKLWEQTREILEKLKIGPARIAHLMEKQSPELLAGLVRELEAK